MGFEWVILDATVPNDVFRMGFGGGVGPIVKANKINLEIWAFQEMNFLALN